jgi:hypothetical protein
MVSSLNKARGKKKFSSFTWYFDSVNHPPFQPVLLLWQTTQGPEKSCQAVVRSPAWHQSEHRWISGPGPQRAGGGGFSVGPDLWLFLSGPLATHWSGQVPKTCGLYSAVTHHTRYSLHGPGSFNLDLMSLLLLVRKWGLVLSHPVCDMPRGSRVI